MTTATINRDTSYHQLTDLGEKQAAVLAVIAERGPVSDRQIAALLEWPINRVNPRRNELVERGLVVEAGTAWDSETGRNVTLWYVISQTGISGRDYTHRNDSDCPANLANTSGKVPLTTSSEYLPGKLPKTALRASQTFSGDSILNPEISLGQRLLQADRAARDAGLTGYWIELYRLVATATNLQELAYAAKVVAGYKVAKYPEYQIVKALGEQKKKEVSR